MTQVMQPDVGESRLPSHFFPNPIQSDSTVRSSRKHKLAAIGFQSEKYISDGLRHFNDTRSGFRITQSNFSSREINVVPSQRFNFGPTCASQNQYPDCGDPLDRNFLFILKRGKNPINAHILVIIKKTLPHRFVETLDIYEWIGSLGHLPKCATEIARLRK